MKTMGVWEEDHRGKVLFSSQHIKGTYYRHGITTDISLDHLAEVMSLRYLHCKAVLFPHPFHIVLFERKSLKPHSPCFSWYFRFNFPKTMYLHKLFEIYLPKRGLLVFVLVWLFFVCFLLFLYNF